MSDIREATRQPPSPRNLLHRVRLPHIIIAVAVITGIVVGSQLLGSSPKVDRIAFRNVTGYDVSVEVKGGDRDGWMPVATASRRSTTTAEAVYDIGDTWIFRFTSQDEEGGQFRISRRDLQRSGWIVLIPGSVEDQLRAKGAPLPP
jgi:hypothetical protein